VSKRDFGQKARMTIRPMISLLVAWTMFPLSARTWTDIQGRKIDAELVRVDGEKAIVKIGEKEAPLAIARLSTMDQKFLEEWTKANPSVSASGKKHVICGQELNSNGEITIIKSPMSQRVKRAIDQPDGELVIGIAIPANFDPNRSQNVLWLGYNHRVSYGNRYRVAVEMEPVVKDATEAGWVVIASDTVTPIRYASMEPEEQVKVASINQDAVEVLEKEWGGFKSWRFVCGGISMGAYESEQWCGFMLREKCNVIGTMQFKDGGTINSHADEAIKLSVCKKSDFGRLKAFVCVPRVDKVFGDEQKAIEKRSADEQVWRKNYCDVLMEYRDGTSIKVFSKEVFKKGLEWFAR
jgi:hypothetical protein